MCVRTFSPACWIKDGVAGLWLNLVYFEAPFITERFRWRVLSSITINSTPVNLVSVFQDQP